MINMACIMLKPSPEEENRLYNQFLRDAGNLQIMLDNQLLSTRDSKPEQPKKPNRLLYLWQNIKRVWNFL